MPPHNHRGRIDVLKRRPVGGETDRGELFAGENRGHGLRSGYWICVEVEPAEGSIRRGQEVGSLLHSVAERLLELLSLRPPSVDVPTVGERGAEMPLSVGAHEVSGLLEGRQDGRVSGLEGRVKTRGARRVGRPARGRGGPAGAALRRGHVRSGEATSLRREPIDVGRTDDIVPTTPQIGGELVVRPHKQDIESLPEAPSRRVHDDSGAPTTDAAPTAAIPSRKRRRSIRPRSDSDMATGGRRMNFRT